LTTPTTAGVLDYRENGAASLKDPLKNLNEKKLKETVSFTHE